jgi:adenylate/nucleoside-diphosphate kinase
MKLNMRQSCSLVLKETIIFWEKARIPTRDFQSCIDKLEKMYDE